MPANDLNLEGLRVLVVEDDSLVSLLIEDMLTDEGCVVVGPIGGFDEALAAARVESVDFALLDVNLAGVKVYPAAEALHARGVPFLFLSGYGDGGAPAGHPDWRVCPKPFQADRLFGMMREALSQRRPAPSA